MDGGTERKSIQMLTTGKIRKKYGGNVCRSCVNEILNIHLHPYECRYEKGRADCPGCGESGKHIVKGFRLRGLKLTIGKKMTGEPVIVPRGAPMERGILRGSDRV